MSSTRYTDAEDLKRIDELRFCVTGILPHCKADKYFLRVADCYIGAAVWLEDRGAILLYHEVIDPMVVQYVDLIAANHKLMGHIGLDYGKNDIGEMQPIKYYKNIWITEEQLDLFFDVTKCTLVNQQQGVSTL